MSTFHAVVWMDHSESHVLMFDKEHIEKELIKSKSHHKHQGKSQDMVAFFKSVSDALESTHEILLTGPSSTRVEFQEWCKLHAHQVASKIVESIKCDHPSDPQVLAMGRQYFQKFDLFH